MEKTAPVLLAVDGSTSARVARPAAAELAAALGAGLVVAYVREPSIEVPTELGIEVEADALEYLDNVVAALRSSGIEAEPILRRAPQGKVAGAILALAAERSAALIVMGSRGVSAVSGVFRGSVAHQVIQAAGCPVLVCPLRAGAATTEHALVERVVLGVDGSAPAARAAAFLARLRGGRYVELVHVREERLVPTLATAAVGAVGAGQWQVESELEAAALVDGPARSLEAAGFHVREHFPSGLPGSVAQHLLTTARAVDAGMIAIGTRGRSDLAGALLGSVTYEVLGHARRPVLVVR